VSKRQVKGGETMRKIMATFSVMIGLLSLLTGCTNTGMSNEAIDPEAVELMLNKNPEIVIAGNEVELQAKFNGITLTDEASVTFDFRTDEKPKLVEATFEDDVFSGKFTFPEKGIQTVYVHLYTGDLHLTKKAWVEVK
jgi:hypothetical protein